MRVVDFMPVRCSLAIAPRVVRVVRVVREACGASLTEVGLPWLPGYEEARPARIGNAAYQFPLDIAREFAAILYEGAVHMNELSPKWRKPSTRRT